MAKLHYQEPASEDQKKAFAKFLAEDEELVVASGFGKAYMRSKFIVGIMWPGIIFIVPVTGVFFWLKIEIAYGLLAGMVVSSFFSLLRALWIYNANRYLLTTRRVIIKKGIMAVKLTSALYDKITHIEVDQGFVDKLFMHHGKIIINTAGTNKDEIILRFIDYPIEFKNVIERLINREREHFGMRAGPVVVEGEVV